MLPATDSACLLWQADDDAAGVGMRTMPAMPSLPSLGRGRWVAVGILVILIVAAAALYLWRTGVIETPGGGHEDDAHSGPARVVGLEATTLIQIDLRSNEEEELGEIPVPDAAVNLQRDEVIYTGTAADDDPTPVLRRAPLDDLEGTRVLGPGSRPLLSPDGSFVAGLEDSNARRVVVYDLEEEDPEPAFPFPEGRWELIGWTDGDVLVARSTVEDRLFATEDASEEASPIGGRRAAEALLLSPTASEMLIANRQRLQVRPLDGDGEAVGVDREAGTNIIQGTWSPTGEWIAGGISTELGTALGLIETSTGEAGPVEGAEGAASQVVWTSTGDHFAGLVPSAANRSDIIVCRPEGGCERPATTGRSLLILAAE